MHIPLVCPNTHRRVEWGTNAFFGKAHCTLCGQLTPVYLASGHYYFRQHFKL